MNSSSLVVDEIAPLPSTTFICWSHNLQSEEIFGDQFYKKLIKIEWIHEDGKLVKMDCCPLKWYKVDTERPCKDTCWQSVREERDLKRCQHLESERNRFFVAEATTSVVFCYSSISRSKYFNSLAERSRFKLNLNHFLEQFLGEEIEQLKASMFSSRRHKWWHILVLHISGKLKIHLKDQTKILGT